METKYYANIEVIKEITKTNGIDEKEFALSSGYSLRTIKDFLNEKNQRKHFYHKIFRIAMALDVPSKMIINNEV